MSIQKVIIKNFKLVEDLEQDFQGKDIIIAGENGIGKSSFLQAIQIALGGKNVPKWPITHGKDKAYVEVITGIDGQEYTFTADFSLGKKPKIEVTSPDGVRDDRKTIIGNIVGQVNFDIDKFVEDSKTSQGRKEQVALFKSYFEEGIIEELDQIQRKITNHEEERAEIGRHKRTNEGFIAEAGIQPGDFTKYAEKINTETLRKESDHAQENNRNITLYEERSNDRDRRAKAIKEEIERLQKEDAEIAEKEGKYLEWSKNNSIIDIAPLNTKMEDALAHNSRVDTISVFKEKEKLVGELTDDYGNKTVLIETERQALSDAIKDMGSPIDGLSFDLDQLYYNGNTVDSESLSTSEIMHLGVQMKMAANPNVKVIFLERGESLGLDRLKDIQKMAHDNGYQILMEEVERGNRELTFKFMAEDVEDAEIIE